MPVLSTTTTSGAMVEWHQTYFHDRRVNTGLYRACRQAVDGNSTEGQGNL
jgi:hypothetical protein